MGINFSDLYLSFGANGIILSDFSSILVLFYIRNFRNKIILINRVKGLAEEHLK